jgi:hypothetical protein
MMNGINLVNLINGVSYLLNVQQESEFVLR